MASSGAGQTGDGESRAGAGGNAGGGGGPSGSGRGRGNRRGRGRPAARSKTAGSRALAASSTGDSTSARVTRTSRRRQPAPPPSDSAVVDVSQDPVLEVADQESMTAPAAELQALDQEHLRKLADAQRARVIKALVLGVIGVLFVAFVLQNARPVNVKLVFGTVTVRMIWVIVASGGLGALAGFLIARPDQNIHFHLPERRGKKTETPGRRANKTDVPGRAASKGATPARRRTKKGRPPTTTAGPGQV